MLKEKKNFHAGSSKTLENWLISNEWKSMVWKLSEINFFKILKPYPNLLKMKKIISKINKENLTCFFLIQTSQYLENVKNIPTLV
jgi:hypothetical protein